MSNNVKTDGADCAVCGLAHDEAIHEATVNIHRWLREQVTQYLYEPEDEEVFQVA